MKTFKDFRVVEEKQTDWERNAPQKQDQPKAHSHGYSTPSSANELSARAKEASHHASLDPSIHGVAWKAHLRAAQAHEKTSSEHAHAPSDESHAFRTNAINYHRASAAAHKHAWEKHLAMHEALNPARDLSSGSAEKQAEIERSKRAGHTPSLSVDGKATMESMDMPRQDPLSGSKKDQMDSAHAASVKRDNGLRLPGRGSSGVVKEAVSQHEKLSRLATKATEVANTQPSSSSHNQAADAHRAASEAHASRLDHHSEAGTGTPEEIQGHESSIKIHDRAAQLHAFKAHRLMKKRVAESLTPEGRRALKRKLAEHREFVKFDSATLRMKIREELDTLPVPVQGEPIDDRWTAFDPESGTLGVPRSEMPQVAQADRGELTQFLLARGVMVTDKSVLPTTLKPTQSEYSPVKVEMARGENPSGAQRLPIVSADDHVLDGHHDWIAHLTDKPDEPMPVLCVGCPCTELLQHLTDFPKSFTRPGAPEQQNESHFSIGHLTVQRNAHAWSASAEKHATKKHHKLAAAAHYRASNSLWAHANKLRKTSSGSSPKVKQLMAASAAHSKKAAYHSKKSWLMEDTSVQAAGEILSEAHSIRTGRRGGYEFRDRINHRITRQEQLAIEANKRGDHDAALFHQRKISDLKSHAHLKQEAVEVPSVGGQPDTLSEVDGSPTESPGFAGAINPNQGKTAIKQEAAEFGGGLEEESQSDRERLYDIANIANDIADAMDNDDKLEPWLRNLIEEAAENLEDVEEYLDGPRGDGEEVEIGEAVIREDNDSAEISKVATLIRLGLIVPEQAATVLRAIQKIYRGNSVSGSGETAALGDLLQNLIGIITGDDTVFNRVRADIASGDTK